jgi:hypothetical protein
MTYPVIVLLNKTADDISSFVKDLSASRGITMDLMAFVLDKVRAEVLTNEIAVLTDMEIETLNKLEQAAAANERNAPKKEPSDKESEEPDEE